MDLLQQWALRPHSRLKGGGCLDHAEGWPSRLQPPDSATLFGTGFHRTQKNTMLSGVFFDSEGPPDMQLKPQYSCL